MAVKKKELAPKTPQVVADEHTKEEHEEALYIQDMRGYVKDVLEMGKPSMVIRGVVYGASEDSGWDEYYMQVPEDIRWDREADENSPITSCFAPKGSYVAVVPRSEAYYDQPDFCPYPVSSDMMKDNLVFSEEEISEEIMYEKVCDLYDADIYSCLHHGDPSFDSSSEGKMAAPKRMPRGANELLEESEKPYYDEYDLSDDYDIFG